MGCGCRAHIETCVLWAGTVESCTFLAFAVPCTQRVLFSSDYLPALTLPNVTLVPGAVTRLSEDGVVLETLVEAQVSGETKEIPVRVCVQLCAPLSPVPRTKGHALPIPRTA